MVAYLILVDKHPSGMRFGYQNSSVMTLISTSFALKIRKKIIKLHADIFMCNEDTHIIV